MSDLYQSLSHTKWDCKYHVVFVPKRRRVGSHPHPDLDPAEARGRLDHRIPEREMRDSHCPKVLRQGEPRLRGYGVSTVGFEAEQIRKYIKNQEDEDGKTSEGSF